MSHFLERISSNIAGSTFRMLLFLRTWSGSPVLGFAVLVALRVTDSDSARESENDSFGVEQLSAP
jgi:hypothetical protein